jgi:tetratricopeptide (TPR) repeat protein
VLVDILALDIAYYERDQFGETIAFFNTAILLNPRDAGAYNNRGRSYLKLDAYDKAVSDFSQDGKRLQVLNSQPYQICISDNAFIPDFPY